MRSVAVRPAVVEIVGGSDLATAFSMINARWTEALQHRGRIRVVSPGAPAGADVTIHHSFAERFGMMPMPSSGRVVAVRTWDFGPFPRAWAQSIVESYDELWVHSRWIRQLAIRGGVPRRRVRLIPLGYDPIVFRPSGPPLSLPTRKTRRFVFSGAPVLRKGIDILLRAWRQAFTRDDDVSLIVKTNPMDVFYQGIDWLARVREAAADPRAAEILLIDRHLPADDVAALFRSAHAAVFPYRAEGFGMAMLEAMVCGCPLVVPRFGPCLDYCDDRSAAFVRPRRIRLPVHQRMAFNTLGFDEEVTEVDFCEVPVDALATALVRIAEMTPATRQAMGRAATARAKHFTWDASAARIEEATEALAFRRSRPVRMRGA